MNITISIEHPAWAHQFSFIIKDLQEKGHNVNVLLVDKDNASLVLKNKGIPYKLLASTTGKNLIEKGFLFLLLTFKYLYTSLIFKTDVFIGRASPMLALVAGILRRPHYIFEDTEVSTFSLTFCRAFSTQIITPKKFLKNLGSKHTRKNIFKELFYLHPSRFEPNEKIKEKYAINWEKPVILLRFISWNASHDFGLKGLSLEQKKQLIGHLKAKECQVIISSEDNIDFSEINELKTIDFSDMHHILYFSDLYIGEGASMASEAVILGTPGIYLNPISAGSIEEQKSSGLLVQIKNFQEIKNILKQVDESLKLASSKTLVKQKHKNLLDSLEDPHPIFMEMILNS